MVSEPSEQAQFPTYSILTAESILAHLNINLEHSLLMSVIKQPESVYSQLLRIPSANLINGIVLQQAYDYQVYVQKLFVDYLMSGEGNEDNEGAGEQMRENIESARSDLVELGKSFEKVEREHKLFISSSQRVLIEIVDEEKTLKNLELHVDRVRDKVQALFERVEVISVQLCNYRKQFKDTIIEVKKMMQFLSEYTIDETQDFENLSSLGFDDHIT